MSSFIRASHRRKAREIGRRIALEHMLAGATEPRAGLLSGEWADDLTDRSLADRVGFPAHTEAVTDDDIDTWWADIDELADVFEQAYLDKFEQVAACDHHFTSRGKSQSWGVSSAATCDHCGVHVMAGSTLDLGI